MTRMSTNRQSPDAEGLRDRSCPPANAASPRFVIQPTRGWRLLDLRELWHYRELAGFLAWRDLKVRYKQTAIGVLWVLLQPLLMMLVFWLFFGRLAGFGRDLSVPYPLFVLAGLLPWQLFSRAMTDSSASVVANQRLLTKVYFPRVLVPIASTLTALVDFAVGSLLLAGVLAFFGVLPPPQVLWLPPFLLLMVLTALGIGFWLAALNAEYRDVMYALPFVTQIWMFLTPVMYPLTILPERWRWLLGLNPLTGVIEGVRWSLLGTGPGPDATLFLSVSVAVLVFLSGLVWFRVRERTLADVLGG